MSEKIRVKIDPELEELIPSYLQNLQENSASIKAGAREKDMELCRSLGHNMKGSGGSYGFDFISGIGKRIEDAARSQEIKKIEGSLMELEDYISRLDISYGS